MNVGTGFKKHRDTLHMWWYDSQVNRKVIDAVSNVWVRAIVEQDAQKFNIASWASNVKACTLFVIEAVYVVRAWVEQFVNFKTLINYSLSCRVLWIKIWILIYIFFTYNFKINQYQNFRDMGWVLKNYRYLFYLLETLILIPRRMRTTLNKIMGSCSRSDATGSHEFYFWI